MVVPVAGHGSDTAIVWNRYGCSYSTSTGLISKSKEVHGCNVGLVVNATLRSTETHEATVAIAIDVEGTLEVCYPHLS